jgi:hypothetical protein
MSQQQPMMPGGATPGGPGNEPLPRPARAWPVVLGVILVALAGLVIWYLVQRPPEGQLTPPEPAPRGQETGAAVPPAEPPPTVQEGDARVRALVGPLSADPELAKWLGVEGLLQRFTTAVANIAEGESPRMVLNFMAPVGGFQVAEDQGRTTIDPRSYERYDAVARVIGSLDAQGSAQAWAELRPLADRVYAEIAPPGRTFEQTFTRAIEHLLEVPVPQGDVEVVPKGALYVYADPKLEGLSRAQKHLLRMGPGNIQIIQRRLQELHTALGLPPLTR